MKGFQKSETSITYKDFELTGDSIGKGSFGKVYRCLRKPDNVIHYINICQKIMAMKVTDLRNFNESDIERLKQEIKLHMTVSHYNIVG